MTTLRFLNEALFVAAVSMLLFGWGTVMFPIGFFALLAWVIFWGLLKSIDEELDDGLPHSFGDSFYNLSEELQQFDSIDDCETRQPSIRANWPDGIGGIE